MPTKHRFSLSPDSQAAELAQGWRSAVYPSVEVRVQILDALQAGLTQNVTQDDLGSTLVFIDEAALEFGWRSSVPPPPRKSPAKQRDQIEKLALVKSRGRFLQILAAMDQPTLLSVLGRRPQDQPQWSIEICTLAVRAISTKQKREMLMLPHNRNAVLAARVAIQAAAERAYRGCDMVRPIELRPGPHSNDPRNAFLKDLIKVWGFITRTPATVSFDPCTEEYGGKFLAFAGACIRPFGDEKVTGLGDGIRAIIRP
jgi:hypothetical protein